MRRAPSGVGDPLHQERRRPPADFFTGLRDKRQPRLETIGPLEIVEAGDRNVGAERCSPRARMARIAPIVAILLPVTIAVGGSGSDRSA